MKSNTTREMIVTSELIRPSLNTSKALDDKKRHGDDLDEITHRAHIRFYNQGGEVRRTLTLYLTSGVHQISLGPLSPEAQGLRVMVTHGEEDTLALYARLEDVTLEQSDEEKRSRLIDPTLYVPMIPSDDRSMINQSPNQSSNQSSNQSPNQSPNQSSTQDHQELSMGESQTYLQQLDSALNRSHTLMRSWLREPLQRSSLDLDEWSEGIEVLEAVIEEQLRELSALDQSAPPTSSETTNHGALHTSSSQDSHNARASSGSQNAIITVEVERTARYVIEVSYQVNSVAWEPIYRVRLSDRELERAGSKPRVEVDLNVEMAARFTQTTEEDWLDVRGEFCLYPIPRSGFPTLSYPVQERLTIPSMRSDLEHISHRASGVAHQTTHQTTTPMFNPSVSGERAPLVLEGERLPDALSRPQLLDVAHASITKLFSDQARLKLSLELELSEARPRVEVLARGDLDALLPLAGGPIHRLIGDEWLGVERHPPLALGEPLQLSFGSIAHITTQMTIKAGDSPLDEHLELRLYNHDHNVRTLLVCQALDHGSLLDLTTEGEEESLPAGWVLSSDQRRLMRWISIPPKHAERLYLHRRLKAPRDS